MQLRTHGDEVGLAQDGLQFFLAKLLPRADHARQVAHMQNADNVVDVVPVYRYARVLTVVDEA